MALNLRLDVAFVGPTDSTLRREQIASAQAALSARRISSEIVESSATLFDALARLQPQVVVLDYFLDRYGTAVDLLSNSTILESSRVVLWCDEPSLDVAVTTMKLGASDYILSTGSRSLELLLEALRPLIQREPIRKRIPVAGEQFVAQALTMRTVLASAETLALQQRCALLFGPSGSGRSSLAREIHRRRGGPGPFIEVDWELEVSKHPFCNLATMTTDAQSENATILLEHLDVDSGELIEEIPRVQEQLLEKNILLLLGVRSEAFRNLCQRLLPEVSVCSIPPLQDRVDDLLPLMRKCIPDSIFRELTLDASDLERLATFSWNGNVRQFLSCVQEAASLLRIKDRAPQASFLTSVREAHDSWEQRRLAATAKRPSPIAVYRAYCKAGCSTRRAAAMLQTDVRYVGRMLAQLASRPEHGRSR